MKFRPHGLFPCILAIALAIAASTTTASAQPTVTIGVPVPTATPFVSPKSVTVTATIVTGTATKVVFYRNNVPVFTAPNSPYSFTEADLGQDTYTYRARAYDSSGNWSDSDDGVVSIVSPYIFKMGQTIDAYGTVPARPTSGANRNVDHTADIQAAVDYLGGLNGSPRTGGTLVFPCTVPSGDQAAVYNIKDTIRIPSNVSIVGESSEISDPGKCLLFWTWAGQGNPFPTSAPWCIATPSQLKKPMFKVDGASGAKARVRFRDLSLRSLSQGPNCYPLDHSQLAGDNTVGIALEGDVSDVIIENISVTDFSYGIKATGTGSSGITNIRIRGVRPQNNLRHLYINSTYAYNWDIQNLNSSGILSTIGGSVEIVKAGRGSAWGDKPGIKFLQLNCNGNDRTGFCIKVSEHGGLYIKQMHHEGVQTGLQVENTSSVSNEPPIVLEGGLATGIFKDASMKLYLIGNHILSAPAVGYVGQDDARLRFEGVGASSTLVDCGDVHWDWTDINGGTVYWGDLQMLGTHSERNRSSFFVDNFGYSYVKPHTVCPDGVGGNILDINDVGGEYFDTGIMPVEPGVFDGATTFDSSDCDDEGDINDCSPELQTMLNSSTNRGTVYIASKVTFAQTVQIPNGRQIVAQPGTELELTYPGIPLFKIELLPAGANGISRMSAVIMRNLTLYTAEDNATGLLLVGTSSPTAATSSDMHFSGLTIEGFARGVDARHYEFPPSETPTPTPTPPGDPMMDGFSWKNLTFVDNAIAFNVESSNTSNWNVGAINMAADVPNSVGWRQRTGGNSMQNVSCRGTAINPMVDCIRLEMASTFVLGFGKTSYVTNSFTVGENGTNGALPYVAYQPSNVHFRDSEFLGTSSSYPGRMNLIGLANIVSLNNKYQYFSIGSTYKGDESRLTYCGDTYLAGGSPAAYPGLDLDRTNLVVGTNTPTRQTCDDERPIPWDDGLKWGQAGDVPLIGNFYDTSRDDFVAYRERSGANSQWWIKDSDETTNMTVEWGIEGDIPLVGRFLPDERSQIVIWRPSTGVWYIYDPNLQNGSTYPYLFVGFGLPGDIPFVGNFLDESSVVSGNLDEIGIYRPSTGKVWITNPRNGSIAASDVSWSAGTGENIVVGDFRASVYQQLAQFHPSDGSWSVLDPRTGNTYVADVTLGTAGDIPVVGNYLPTASSMSTCDEIGVWRPSTQQFLIADPFSNCGSRTRNMVWGSTNDFPNSTLDVGDCVDGICPDDVPLAIMFKGGIRRPAVWRPTEGVFTESNLDGYWWVHDAFVP